MLEYSYLASPFAAWGCMPAGMLYTPLPVVGAGAARAQAALEPMGFLPLHAERFL